MTNPCSTSWPTSCTKEHGGGAYAAHTTRGGSARQRVELWFGPNFGGVAVSYRQVRGYTRGSTAEQTFHRNGNTATHGPMRSSTSTNRSRSWQRRIGTVTHPETDIGREIDGVPARPA